jgi:hypothetical protein
MRRPSPGKAVWIGGVLAILALGAILGVIWGWPALAAAALVAGLFGSAPGWLRYLEERAGLQAQAPARLDAAEPADTHPPGSPAPATAPAPSASGHPEPAAPTSTPVPQWTPELLQVVDLLPDVLPSPADVDQVASESGIATHAYATSGDKAANRWHGLVDHARVRGRQKLDLVLQRAAQRSHQDPRLVPAIDRWRRSSPER